MNILLPQQKKKYYIYEWHINYIALAMGFLFHKKWVFLNLIFN
jgi:hypothetical protein